MGASFKTAGTAPSPSPSNASPKPHPHTHFLEPAPDSSSSILDSDRVFASPMAFNSNNTLPRNGKEKGKQGGGGRSAVEGSSSSEAGTLDLGPGGSTSSSSSSLKEQHSIDQINSDGQQLDTPGQSHSNNLPEEPTTEDTDTTNHVDSNIIEEGYPEGETADDDNDDRSRRPSNSILRRNTYYDPSRARFFNDSPPPRDRSIDSFNTQTDSLISNLSRRNSVNWWNNSYTGRIATPQMGPGGGDPEDLRSLSQIWIDHKGESASRGSKKRKSESELDGTIANSFVSLSFPSSLTLHLTSLSLWFAIARWFRCRSASLPLDRQPHQNPHRRRLALPPLSRLPIRPDLLLLSNHCLVHQRGIHMQAFVRFGEDTTAGRCAELVCRLRAYETVVDGCG